MPDAAPDSRATKPSLLLRIRDPGDAASWGEFADLYGPLIRGYCRPPRPPGGRRRRRGPGGPGAGRPVDRRVRVRAGPRPVPRLARDGHPEQDRPVPGGPRPGGPGGRRRELGRLLEAIDVAGGRHRMDRPSTPGSSRSPWPGSGTTSRPTTWDAFERIWVDDRPSPEVARRSA